MPGYYCNPKVMGNTGENASFGAFLLNLKKKKSVKNIPFLKGIAFPPNIQSGEEKCFLSSEQPGFFLSLSKSAF